MKPLVSIGLPVHDGEAYLADTLDSLLSQTFEDLEIIVADNASTDGTEEVCRAYAAREQRIRYLRSDTNWGASWSFNLVAQLARGRYFKWQAADDLCAPEFVERCVEVLESEPSVALVLPKVLEIDEHGDPISEWKHSSRVYHTNTRIRFHDLICIRTACIHIFGLMRTNALKRTGMIGNYIESDIVMLAELALHGRFYELPETLFLHRIHPGQSVRVYESRYDKAAWFDPRMSKHLIFPEWRLGREHIRAIGRSPLRGRQKWECYAQVFPWFWHRKGMLVYDLRWARYASEPVRRGRDFWQGEGAQSCEVYDD